MDDGHNYFRSFIAQLNTKILPVRPRHVLLLVLDVIYPLLMGFWRLVPPSYHITDCRRSVTTVNGAFQVGACFFLSHWGHSLSGFGFHFEKLQDFEVAS